MSKPPLPSNFEPASLEEIHNLILSSTDASCSLDVIPAGLLKSCINALVVLITQLINLSPTAGVFLTSFKHALVSPLLKQVVYACLCNHLESFSSLSRFQSA